MPKKLHRQLPMGKAERKKMQKTEHAVSASEGMGVWGVLNLILPKKRNGGK